MCTVPRSLWLGRHGLHGSAVLPSRFYTLPELLGPSGLARMSIGSTSGNWSNPSVTAHAAACLMLDGLWSRLESYWCQILCSLSFLLTITFPSSSQRDLNRLSPSIRD